MLDDERYWRVWCPQCGTKLKDGMTLDLVMYINKPIKCPKCRLSFKVVKIEEEDK